MAIRSDSDLGTLGQVFAAEEYRTERLRRHGDLMASYHGILARNQVPLILDCGANIGLSALYFARLFPDAAVVAIEPDASNIALARLNCAGHSNVRFIEAGVANTGSAGVLSDPNLGNNAYRTSVDEQGKVKLVSIGSVLADEAASNRFPYIVKIDIEGFEENLFAANLEWVDRFPLLIIELHDWLFPNSAKSRNFLRCIAAFDRDFVHIGENVFSIKNGTA